MAPKKRMIVRGPNKKRLPTCLDCGKDYKFRRPENDRPTFDWHMEQHRRNTQLCDDCLAKWQAKYDEEGHTHLTLHQFVQGHMTGTVQLVAFIRGAK